MPDAAAACALAVLIVRECPHLLLQGLMTIGEERKHLLLLA